MCWIPPPLFGTYLHSPLVVLARQLLPRFFLPLEIHSKAIISTERRNLERIRSLTFVRDDKTHYLRVLQKAPDSQ